MERVLSMNKSTLSWLDGVSLDRKLIVNLISFKVCLTQIMVILVENKNGW